MSEVSPGWYQDPADQAVQRYWDGEGWLGEPIPAGAPTPLTPPTAAAPPSDGAALSAAPPPVSSPPDPSPPDPSPPRPPSVPPPVVFPPPPDWPRPSASPPPGAILPPGAVPLPPGTPLPPGMLPGGKLPPGAIAVLLPGSAVPTVVPLVPVVKPHGFLIAPLWARFLARLVDIFVVLALNVVVNGWFAYQYWHEIYPQLAAAVNRSMAGQKVEPITASSRLSYLEIVIIILAAALWFAYEVPAIATNGQTFGKRLLRVKVMRLESTEPVGFGRAIRRWNPLGLPTLMWYCGIGFILQIVDSVSPVFDWPLRRAFHDRSAATVVVRVPPAHKAPQPHGETT